MDTTSRQILHFFHRNKHTGEVTMELGCESSLYYFCLMVTINRVDRMQNFKPVDSFYKGSKYANLLERFYAENKDMVMGFISDLQNDAPILNTRLTELLELEMKYTL